MTLEKPTWLNPCFIEKILQKSESDNSIQVIDIFSKPATSKGDNYTSVMIKIIAEFSRVQSSEKITEKKSVIIKISPTGEGVQHKFVTQSGIFYTEISMMSDTLDKMNKLLKPQYRLSGKSLYTQTENPTFLVLEDLAPLGFRMADRLSGLDLTHSVLALRGLARFHAASVAVSEKEPKQKEMYRKGIFYNQQSPETAQFFVMSIKALADEVANWPEMKKYSEKIAKLSDHIYQIGIDTTRPLENEFNVINHGDAHINNMMFKYDNNNKPTDHIFVDFQLCIYASPALDLLYFFNSSLSTDVENKRDILLNEYLRTLSATMKQLNCKTQPPTMEELKATLKRKASYGMITSFAILPMILCPKTEAKDLNEIMGTGTFINPGLKSESYKKIMIERLPLYDEWGLLDLGF